MLRVRRPIDRVVLNCCVTATKVTHCRFKARPSLEINQGRDSSGHLVDDDVSTRDAWADLGKLAVQGRGAPACAARARHHRGGPINATSLALWLRMKPRTHRVRCSELKSLFRPIRTRFACGKCAAFVLRFRRMAFTPKNRDDQRAPRDLAGTSDSERYRSPRFIEQPFR